MKKITRHKTTGAAKYYNKPGVADKTAKRIGLRQNQFQKMGEFHHIEALLKLESGLKAQYHQLNVTVIVHQTRVFRCGRKTLNSIVRRIHGIIFGIHDKFQFTVVLPQGSYDVH